MTEKLLPGAPRLQGAQPGMLARIWGTGRGVTVIPGHNATLDALVRRGCLVRVDGALFTVSAVGVLALRNHFVGLVDHAVARVAA